jgi:hypothetical protein
MAMATSSTKFATLLVKRDILVKIVPIVRTEGPIRRTREGGSEWEPIKILLEGDRNSNKMNKASNTCLRLLPKLSKPK